MKYKSINNYHVKFWYATPYTWNKNGLQDSWIKVRAHNIQRAIACARKHYPALIVKEVTFI